MNGLVKFWIWLCAFATLAGWSLSVIGQLNRLGYGIAFLIAAVVFSLWRKYPGKVALPHSPKIHGGVVAPPYLIKICRKVARRFRRPLPLAFLALAVLILVGGAIYPPSNYTGLQYRLERILQWLAQGGWWWIHSPNYRMNDRACGIEWMFTPLLWFTKSDRLLFLVNFIPFLLLPGLIFSVFTQLGIRARVTWQWMWLLPTGYNFLLQAGSIGNDTFPTVFALAAMDFGLRARKSGKNSDLWNSILAAALLTGAKASNLPLLLPWAIAIFPSLPLLRKKIVGTILISLIAAAVSFLPNAILNAHFCGDWSGANLEEPRLAMKNPIVGIYGNFFQFTLDNFAPPIFPMAHWWNEHAPLFMPHFLVAAADKYFDGGFFALGELPTEDWAGIGFGLSILLVTSLLTTFCRRTGTARAKEIPLICRLILVSGWLALLVYCTKSGLTNAARIIAPYYPLLVASLLVAVRPEMVRRIWWKILVGAALISAFVVLILSPDRPLWPAKTILSHLSAHSNSASISRPLKVYTTYSQRFDPLAGIRALLPPEIKTIGFMAGPDDMDISLWRPYGSRIVRHFFVTDSAERIRGQVQYLVVGGFNLKNQGIAIDDWLQKSGAELAGETNATLKVGEGAQPWYVVRFK